MPEITASKSFIYEFGEFVLDPQEKILSAKGRPIHLPVKEFETLLLLVENRGRALSKEEMMQAIWQDTFVEENNLAKYVSRLRKILNTDGQNHIETLPKRGYRFASEVNRTALSAGEMSVEKRTVKRVTLKTEELIETPHNRPKIAGKSFSLILGAVLGLIILFGAAGIWYRNAADAPAAAAPRINSIAVLPLKSLSGEEADESLGLGLADALITKIGAYRNVTTRPISAVAKFAAAPPQDALEIGRRLQVDAILEGTIQRSEERLRINARLLNVATGEQLWTEKFDEPDGGIFALQDALSAKIAQTLAFAINKNELAGLARRPTENVEAYERYLRGRFYQTQNTERSLVRSIELYEQAVALDPNFADAHAGLADANMILYNFGLRPAAQIIPRARESVNRALQLNADLSAAHTTLALIEFLFERDWPAAEKSLQRATELDPNNADAFLRYGYFLTANGEFQDALMQLEKARRINPLAPLVRADIGLVYLCARDYPAAIRELENVVAENSEFALPHWFLGASYESSADSEKAFAAYVRALELEGGVNLAARLRSVQKTGGTTAAYELWLNESLTAKNGENRPALNVAFLYSIHKDRQKTLDWLEEAAAENDPTLWQVKYLFRYDFVRDDERFRNLLRKVD